MAKTIYVESIQGESWKDFQTRFKYASDEIRNAIPYKRFIAIQVNLCDSAGCYSKVEIHIFRTFIDANELLNSLMYRTDAVEVYEVDTETECYTNVFSKCYDSTSYNRLAGISGKSIEDIELIRTMYNFYDFKEVNININ